MRLVATRRLWRYVDGGLEVTEQGGRCDWAATAGTYLALGWCVEGPEPDATDFVPQLLDKEPT